MPEGLRERKKLTTRQAISRAALRLAVERGPGNVRREDIAAEVDVSLRTFSNYFSSKEEAIVALAADRAEGLVETLRARPSGESLRSALLAAFLLPYAGEPPSHEWVAQIRVVVSAPEVQGAYLKAMAAIERHLAAAIADRLGLRADSLRPRVLAAAALGAERVAIAQWLDSAGTDRLPALIEEAVTEVVAA
jgi:AcrR family transcriptional regulator